ncbi:hypothetical protein HYFRA_00003779 [Hymenoscyphus fraxineus]|uniref:HECT-type E3 ubiquitin transferase n=1 Tax=Hymenoscyphus fraxineus TaxID=746836 RepID=A0A9N9KYM3_9HELO|nr:hypothetical protein HYFRA_00003779 [Hymenoscyphus fraxineus]
MFSTFNGTSRRPRQVNLSGQNTNPFAAMSGTQSTVANAQQERLLRQQERDRLNASKRIQRTWRGHRVRTQLADSRRKIWDQRKQSLQSPSDSGALLVEQAKLVVAFFNPRRPDDIERMVILGQMIYSTGYEAFLNFQGVNPILKKLACVTLHALQSLLPQYHATLLQFLVTIIDRAPQCFPPIRKSYYTYLSELCLKSTAIRKDKELLLASIRAPLVQHVDSDRAKEVLAAHSAFALNFLTTPNLATILGDLGRLTAVTDVGVVSEALVREFANSSFEIHSEARLWLLAHLICLHRLQQRDGQEPNFLRALSIQLSSSASDIIGRLDGADTEIMESSSEDADREVIPPLPDFIRDELLSLVNQTSITGLLAKFNVDYVKASAASEEDASVLASFALTLLRIFPRRGDEIRMWLYLGSISTSSGNELPALKFFWQAMSKTNTFATIKADSQAALSILRPQMKPSSNSSTPLDAIADREWRTILLFLELYTFVLRFTDDEEFLTGSESDLRQADSHTSRMRASALPLEDVMRLTIFLKNLAFTTCYNAGELSNAVQQGFEGGIGAYFGNSSTSYFHDKGTEEVTKRIGNRPFAGIAGMTFDYVRTIVTGVMRMLYERDSRRRFLPKGHWLMTSRFDMQGFITSVVLEEERQHEVGEDGEEEDDDSGFRPSQEGRSEMGLVGMGRPRQVMAIEIRKDQQRKALQKKALAAIGPRLMVLKNMPFVIPFETRVQIFREFVLLDKTRRRNGTVDPDIWRMSMLQQSHMASRPARAFPNELGRHHAKIRRDDVFEDAYAQFYELGEGLKEPIQITFVDKFDTVEAGIDGGGVTKEFLTSVTNEAFRGEGGPKWFISNDQNLLYPNPSAVDERRQWLRKSGLTEGSLEWRENIAEVLRRYEFLGRVVGKCLYEGILIDIGFAGFFLLKWAAAGSESNYRANINDLRDLDESLYQGLLKLKNYPGNVEDFSLDFTITDTISPPGEPTETITRDLMRDGSNVPVTNENKTLYISCVARHRLQNQPYQQTQAFLKGLGEIIKPYWLSMFNQSELQTLVGGDSSEIDVEDLRANTHYGGVYQIGDDGLEHTTIAMFWQVMKNFDDGDRRKVLKYVTSTPRAPLLGFSQLNPKFSIRDAGSDETRLPSTSTCVNLLKLPMYTSIGVLKQKLLYAVNSGAGFDLS